MDFGFTEEQMMLGESIARTLQRDSDAAAIFELGTGAALISEDAGGFGGTGADILMVFRTLGREAAVTPLLDSVVLRNVGPDGVGEIQTRGPHVVPGYFRNPKATADAFDAEGFLCTGDLGRIDADGNLHVAGRARELIIRGGFNVYPPEVEAALNDHPHVIQTAVIGRKIDGGNEEVLAFCQTDQAANISEHELRDHATARLSAYKRPTRIVVTSALPTSPNGKILKQKLIETFRDELGFGDEG
ncbi:AMP-binding protein [Paracoccus sp. 11-3]|uniref:AMP-binding protein n=1 Tax=Paracoccus amoyensis TaxID=2760093 RepID=A0A926GF74_9RHOB|nr:fatty acid--CoA ligase family protein [Paracoccus amoyensis]MBC9247187.1 AMP-binding protein [Paracoccus amoyensis]